MEQEVLPHEELTTEFWTREQAVGLANWLLAINGVKGDDGHQAVVSREHVENYKIINKFRGIEAGQTLATKTVDGVTLYLQVEAIMRPEHKELSAPAEV